MADFLDISAHGSSQGGGLDSSPQPDESPSQDSPFDSALRDAMRQCKLKPDYDSAMALWGVISRTILKMGAPVDLVLSYGDELIAHYEQKEERRDKHALDVIFDNHGNINK